MTLFASVYPLVTARAVAQAYTYEVPEGTEKGAVVDVRFGNSKRRGVVTEIGVTPPDGVKTAPVERVAETLPPALVDLALWMADYYGSTPARALELVAPVKRARRGERRASPARPRGRGASPAGLAGEAPPAKLTPEQEGAVARIVAAMDGKGGRYLLYGATGSGK